MKRWRRPLILIALLLLVGGGAMVNIAVAWGIAASGPVRPPSVERRAQPWRWFVPDDWPQASQHRVTASGFGARRTFQLAAVVRRNQLISYSAESYEAGWPLRCVYCVQLKTANETIVAGGTAIPETTLVPLPRRLEGVPIEGHFKKEWFAQSHHRLPIAAIWPAWLVNTFFYTALLALPLSFFPIRRRLRARRGRCPKCGYDLAGLGGAGPGGRCPECGAG